jgi:hypothetical protein
VPEAFAVHGLRSSSELSQGKRVAPGQLSCFALYGGQLPMQKLILISILFVDVLIPIWAARDRSAIRGLKKALFSMCICNGIYLVLVLFVYPRL